VLHSLDYQRAPPQKLLIGGLIHCFLPVFSSASLFVCYQICERDISKTYDAANWHKWSTWQGHETINFGAW